LLLGYAAQSLFLESAVKAMVEGLVDRLKLAKFDALSDVKINLALRPLDGIVKEYVYELSSFQVAGMDVTVELVASVGRLKLPEHDDVPKEMPEECQADTP